jgi:predicted esterase
VFSNRFRNFRTRTVVAVERELTRKERWPPSAIKLVEQLVEKCAAAGKPSERVAICGFSEGACLATEFVARNPRCYAGLIAFMGGFIGPPGSDLQHAGSLAGTPVLLSSGDPALHVPWQRDQESAHILQLIKAKGQFRRYPGCNHTILPEELFDAKTLLEPVMGC